MKLSICFLGITGSVLILSSAFIVNKEKVVQQEKYELVWSDEFSADGVPDEKNWNYETGFVRNQEDQWYQKKMPIVKPDF